MNLIPSARRIATPTELGFSVMFGLRPSVAAILAEMFEGAHVRALRTHVHSLRAALSEEAIDTTEAGYALTAEGRAECESALTDFRSWVIGEAA